MAVVAPFDSRTILGLNRETYQQLCLAAGLNLRRQLLFAVCDDAVLQSQLAQELAADLRQPPADFGAVPTEVITIRLSPRHLSPLRPMLEWLKRHPEGAATPPVLFQVLGIDQLTRLSPVQQRRFLDSLSRVELLLGQLDISVLLWLPRPWLHKVRFSQPRLWQLRSRLFEFVGEPTAAAAATPATPATLSNGALMSMLSEDLAALETEAAGDNPLLATDESSPSEPPPLVTRSTPADANGSSAEAVTPPPPPEDPPPAASPPLHPHHPIALQVQQLQLLVEQQAGPRTVAQAYLALGQLCRDAIEAGDTSAEMLEFAIEAYRHALKELPQDGPDWCDGLNDLGSLCWLRSQVTPDPDTTTRWLQESINAYGQALTVPATVLSQDAEARISSNLGTAHGLMAVLEQPAVHLEQAVRAYHRAIGCRPAAAYPQEYASLQNSLGAVHWRLSQLENSRQHLHSAITAYQEALQHHAPERAPQDYALLQNNLGIAYWSLAQHERPAFLLEQAVAAYQAALAFRTPATDAAGCAATQNNLGTAYWDLAQQCSGEQQLQLWHQSVAAYEAALDAAQRATEQAHPLSFDLGATCHSAGVVHDHIAQRSAEGAAAQSHLQRSLRLYLSALELWQQQPERLSLLSAAVTYNVRLHFEILGSDAQQQALSQLPPQLLAAVMPQL